MFKRIVILCALFLLCTTSAAMAQDEAVPGDGQVFAPPLGLPEVPADFEFNAQDMNEESIIGRWKGSALTEEYLVFRQRVPLLALGVNGGMTIFSPSLMDEVVTPFDWQLIKTLPEVGYANYAFSDHGIPAIDTSLPTSSRRKLGEAYCYKVEAHNAAGVATSPVLCARLRGINQPQALSIISTSPTEITIQWRDHSALELGFKMSYRSHEGNERITFIHYGENFVGPFRFSGLTPDTEYCVYVRVFDAYSDSDEDGDCTAKTDPEPDAGPNDETFTVWLNRVIVDEGAVPYEGRFPAFGILNGELKKVKNPAGFGGRTLFFLIPGNDIADCNNPEAVVLLPPGEELSPADLETLYGDETPPLPIYFLACIEFQPGTLPNVIPINITYTKDE